MTSLDHIWINANPEYRDQLRRANEARSAAVYAAWRGVLRTLGGAVRGVVAAFDEARRRRRTYFALNELSDRQLQDIGLTRGDIHSVAEATARMPTGLYPSVADLREAEARSAAREAPRQLVSDRRRRTHAPWVAKPPRVRVQQQQAAG